jgi:hypothetical protein
LAYELETAENTYSSDSEESLPPKKYWANLTDPTNDEMQNACDRANYDAGNEAIRNFIDRLEKNTEKVRKKFQERLFLDGEDKWPKKWMQRDLKIRAMLNKTRFAEVMNYLWTNANKEMTKDLAELLPPERTILRVGEKKLPLVLVRVDPEEMATELKISSALAYKYIRRFSELGIIREQGNTPGYWVKVYSIGTWLKWEANKQRRNPFLINTPAWRDKLRDFRVGKGGVKYGDGL